MASITLQATQCAFAASRQGLAPRGELPRNVKLVRCQAQEGRPEAGESTQSELATSRVAQGRRQLLSAATGLSLAAAASAIPGCSNVASPPAEAIFGAAAWAAQDVRVGTYLPKAGEGDLVTFTAGPKDTPALRAGNVPPYSFFLPPTWYQQRIANILSGNYCQPKCAEPWIEVKFEDPKQGTLQVVASPMVRLTNKLNATIEDIGPPEDIMAALGPFVTGDSYEPEELVDASVKQVGEQTYYVYTLETPYARSGAHNLAVATAKGSAVLLLVISASEGQWNANQPLLRQLADSFRV